MGFEFPFCQRQKFQNVKKFFLNYKLQALTQRLFSSDKFKFCSNFLVEKISFSNVVKYSRKVKLRRSYCLNFKHANVNKRNEAI